MLGFEVVDVDAVVEATVEEAAVVGVTVLVIISLNAQRNITKQTFYNYKNITL